MPFDARSTELLTAAIYGAHKSETIDEAVERLSGQLRSYYDLWLTGIATISDRFVLRAISVWSAGDRTIETGIEVGLDLTPATRAAAERALRGETFVVDMDRADWGLLGDAYRRNGIRSFLIAPFRHNGRRHAIGLASTTVGAFEDYDIVFMRGLAAGLAERFGTLIEASGRLER